MTEPSQYFKGRTVQEQMDEVIGYVDKRAEEVAAAKAGAVLQPAEEAKTAAQAAAEAAEAAKDTTLAALPEIRQDISGLKAEDTALDGRLDTVELKVQTAEGNIVTIQGKITAIENKNTQQDSAIAALQTADEQNVKINHINEYAIGLTGNQDSTGTKGFTAIKTPFLEIANNFRPVVYYGAYDPMDMREAQRVRVITVFPSVDKKESPVFRVETFDDATTIGVDISSTVYGGGANQSITMRVRKSDGMGYVTVPSRGSTNVSDYYPGEVVTINTLKKLGLIQ